MLKLHQHRQLIPYYQKINLVYLDISDYYLSIYVQALFDNTINLTNHSMMATTE